MKLRLEIDLNDETIRTSHAVDRYLEIGRRLRAAGFQFEEMEDLFPASLDLKQPWTAHQADDGVVVYEQGPTA